eukprot:8203368-Pyramimonas_sp.AAC.1
MPSLSSDCGLLSYVPRPSSCHGLAVRHGGGLPRQGRDWQPEVPPGAARRLEGFPGVRSPVSG